MQEIVNVKGRYVTTNISTQDDAPVIEVKATETIQITCNTEKATEGSVAILFKPDPLAPYEPLILNNVAKVVDLSSDNNTFLIQGFFIDSVKFKHEGVQGEFDVIVRHN